MEPPKFIIARVGGVILTEAVLLSGNDYDPHPLCLRAISGEFR